MSAVAAASPPAAGFPPHILREYSLIADGERGALIGPRGDIVWMCWPRWHDDPVFASLVGGDGVYAVTPAGRFVWGGYYEAGTLIWRSRWVTSSGIVECREALAFPGDRRRAVLLRRVIAQDAPAEVDVVLAPRAGFSGRGLDSPRREQDGSWTARLGAAHARWSGAVGAVRPRQTQDGCWLSLRLRVEPAEPQDLVLELCEQPITDDPVNPDRQWLASRAEWERAVPPLREVIATRDARHSYAVMRGLTSSSGGMAAAATTSLPERAKTGRNYDYRYAWIRDQCFAGQAAAAAGGTDLLDRSVAFITQRLLADGRALAPAYTVDGGPVPDQRRLDLPGYPGGSGLVGNRVNRQFQLDSLGEALLLFAAAARQGRLEGEGWEAARIAADTIAARWQEPDAGVWELAPQRWTHSRLICAAGLRAVAAQAGGHGPGGQAGAWTAMAEEILADADRRCVHPSGRWQRSPTDATLDGALLLPAVRGATPADDRRAIATWRAYLAGLARDGYAYRFRHDERPLGEAEGAFLMCGFVTALACHQQGDRVQAVRWFERNRGACGPSGLFSEEYDVAQRQLRGNLPQAFVHALMLECAARLAAPWRGGA